MPIKKQWNSDQMSTVELASEYANRLIEREARGPGDTENAMRRIEARYGLGYWLMWTLRYRRPKTITADNFAQLRNAYLATCERQLAALTHELGIERAKSGNDSNSDLAAEAEALAAKIKARLGR